MAIPSLQGLPAELLYSICTQLSLPDIQAVAMCCRHIRQSLRSDTHFAKTVLRQQAAHLAAVVTLRSAMSLLDKVDFGVDSVGCLHVVHVRPEADVTAVYRVAVKLTGRVSVSRQDYRGVVQCVGGIGDRPAPDTLADVSAGGGGQATHHSPPLYNPHDYMGSREVSRSPSPTHPSLPLHDRQPLPDTNAQVLTPTTGGIPVDASHRSACPLCSRLRLVRIASQQHRVDKTFRVFFRSWQDSFEWTLRFGVQLRVHLVHVDIGPVLVPGGRPPIQLPPPSASGSSGRGGHERQLVHVESNGGRGGRSAPMDDPGMGWPSTVDPEPEIQVTRYGLRVRPEDIGWINAFWNLRPPPSNSASASASASASGASSAASSYASSASSLPSMPADRLGRPGSSGTPNQDSPARPIQIYNPWQ